MIVCSVNFDMKNNEVGTNDILRMIHTRMNNQQTRSNKSHPVHVTNGNETDDPIGLHCKWENKSGVLFHSRDIIIKVFRFQRKTLLLFYCFFFFIMIFFFTICARDFSTTTRLICMKFSGLM